MEKYFIAGIAICVLGILGIVVNNLWRSKKRGKTTQITDEHKTKAKPSKEKQAEDVKSFPRLNIERLRDFAKRFVNKYPEFSTNSVTLYRYHYDDSDESPYPKMEYDPVHKNFYTVEKALNIETKYALVYEIDAKVRESQETMNKITVLRLYADARTRKELGIDAGFSDVYIDKPSKEMDYLKEWIFCIIISDEEMPDFIMTDEKSVMLFP